MPRENALLSIRSDSAPGTGTVYEKPRKRKRRRNSSETRKKKLRKQKRMTIRQKVIKQMTEETCL